MSKRLKKDYLLSQFGADSAIMLELISAYEKTRPQLDTRFHEAIELQSAQHFQKAAHALKGALGVFAEDQMVEEARTIEEFGKKGQFASAHQLFQQLRPKLQELDTEVARFKTELQKR